MDLLDAVNVVVAGLGEPPATALDTGGTTIYAEAESMIDAVSREVQSQGWSCNVIVEKEFTPNGLDQIDLSDILRVRPQGSPATNPYTVRNEKLYDTVNETDQFDAPVTLWAVEFLAFNALPESLGQYIAAKAAVRFQRYKKRGSADDAFLNANMQERMLTALREEQDMRRTNVFRHGTDGRDVLGRSGYRL